MKTSREGKIFLATLEGIATKIYKDSVGVRTIGIGATKSEIPNINTLPWDYEITIPEVFDLFDKSLKKYEDAVNHVLTREVKQHEFDALVSVTYNIGIGGMKGSTFMKRVNAGARADSVRAAMMAWTKAGGKTLKGLVNRRTREANLYVSGDYGSTVGTLIEVTPSHHPVYKKTIDVAKYI